jgi:hypothetical protein
LDSVRCHEQVLLRTAYSYCVAVANGLFLKPCVVRSGGFGDFGEESKQLFCGFHAYKFIGIYYAPN